jgi:glycosyltransferase involved in cell wall biosynthesis
LIKNKTLIISPSGNFYGSEQVLYDFLCHTAYSYIVFVPDISAFYKKLSQLEQHKIVGFGDLRLLYLKIFIFLFSGRYKSLYINEGGHIKYTKLLARFLKSVQFIIHIRLLEDCDSKRLGDLPKNIQLVSISDYISSKIKSYHPTQIYDPIDTKLSDFTPRKTNTDNIIIAVIGRVSASKGLKNYAALFDFIQQKECKNKLVFTFYGDVMHDEPEAEDFFKKYNPNPQLQIQFLGFVEDQKELYSGIDMVLHLNENEPLGRIGLESWAHGIPFICFNKGGAGEINTKLGMDRFSLSLEGNWRQGFLEIIEFTLPNFDKTDLPKVKAQLDLHFGVARYVQSLEALFVK